jgi:hypothetical protein
MTSLRAGIALVVVGASAVLTTAAQAQILTGPFSPASPPFISPLGNGFTYLGTTQIELDTKGTGIPDTIYDLPVEIQPTGGSAYLTDARLSPTEKTLYTVKTPGNAPVPGCNPGDARVYFHDIGAPPSGLTALNPGGTCVAGPIAIGPLFNDLSTTQTIRTAIVVGAAPPVPSITPVLWVDLVHGGANLDTLNYVTDVEPTAGGIQFAPSGNAAYIQHGSNTATPKYTLVDLCVSPIAAAGSLATGDLPAGIPSAWVINGSGAGTYIAEVRINGSPILTSRLNLSVCQTSSGPPPNPTVNDAGDALHGGTSGCAMSGGGDCTLRDAITFANKHPGLTILFNIPGGGVHTISPATALPTITTSMTIDGYTQPGASLNTNPPTAGTNAAIKIEINGGGLGFSGLFAPSGRLTVRGLAIGGMANAIYTVGGGSVITGNFIGTDATGMIARPNSNHGIQAVNGVIGGPNPGDRNVVSACNGAAVFGGALLIQGNIIGLNAAGTASLGNVVAGIGAGNGSVIGGTTPGERNVIAGNGNTALSVGDSCTVSGNYIGVDLTGSTSLAEFDEVVVGGSNNTIGGTAGTSPGGPCTGACNVIGGAATPAILVIGSGHVIAGNFIGLNASGTAALASGIFGICMQLNGATNTTIGGTSAAARNVMTGCVEGIDVGASTGTTISGNFLGTDSTGASLLSSRVFGSVAISNESSGTVIGGTTGVSSGGFCTGACNVIGGWGIGIYSNSGGLQIKGNHIGVGLSAGTALPNDLGIRISSIGPPPAGVTIGGAASAAGNLIAANTSSGIEIDDGGGILIENNTITANGLDPSGPYLGHDGILIAGGKGTTITNNSIFGNKGLGIDLPPIYTPGRPTPNDPCDADTGANDLQNFPVITSAASSAGTTTIGGTLNSTAGSTFTVDFYASPACNSSGYGEGKIYLGSTMVMTDGSCNGSFNAPLPVAAAAGSYITATATNPDGSTSEFSQCFRMSGGSPVPSQYYTIAPCRVVDTRNPAGPLGGPALAAGSDRDFPLAGNCGIPPTASAVSINVTVTQPTTAGDLRAYPGGSPRPLVSTINYQGGQTRANNAVVALGGAGDLTMRCDQGSGTVQVIIDVNGYFQ